MKRIYWSQCPGLMALDVGLPKLPILIILGTRLQNYQNYQNYEKNTKETGGRRRAITCSKNDSYQCFPMKLIQNDKSCPKMQWKCSYSNMPCFWALAVSVCVILKGQGFFEFLNAHIVRWHNYMCKLVTSQPGTFYA